LEIGGIEAADEADFGEVDDLDFLGGAVIEVLEGRPILGANAEEVDTEFDGGGLGGRLGGEGGGGDEEVASGHGRLLP
jgi:hypothetical protein